MPYRLQLGLSYFIPRLGRLIAWTLFSREYTNFTYDITVRNSEYLGHTLSTVTGEQFDTVMAYLHEISEDNSVREHIITSIKKSRFHYGCDSGCAFGRRIGWYALVRILKPRIVVETGVDKGHGAVLLCAALLRNRGEGFPGKYFGTDINPDAGFLLSEPYNDVGTILYGDSVQSLQSIPHIDLFINDSDHSAQYERREYEAIIPKLEPGGLILGDNCHTNDVLANFSAEQGRHFIFFREDPKDHWYPGTGIGISFVRPTC